MSFDWHRVGAGLVPRSNPLVAARDNGRASLAIALIGLLGAIGGPTAGAVIAIEGQSGPPQPECAVVLEHMLDVVDAHPGLKAIYADPTQRVMSIESTSDTTRCGNYMPLVRRAARK